jgi:peptide/nickel transport system permease protein
MSVLEATVIAPRRRFHLSVPAKVALGVLVLFYFAALFAPFLAPYSPQVQDREHPFHPPTRIHASSGGLFVRGIVMTDPLRRQYREDALAYPVRLLQHGHLLSVEAPGRIYLLGTDGFGRDVFSRLLFGARISLSVGLVGIVITYVLGLLFGGLAGYYRGTVDTVLMRASEVLMSVPALYLILALRAMFPVDLPSGLLYVAVVAILSLVLWASLARIIRGMVLSIREFDYVHAAEALGASPIRIILRHVLPNTASFVIVAATLSVPAYILGEVALSFLGAGVQEPTPSWGNMLRDAQNVPVLASFPWILAPGVGIFLTVLAFNFLGDGLRDALDPRTAGTRT